ncbi:bacteriohemerythrin [Desulfurispira natronophila]
MALSDIEQITQDLENSVQQKHGGERAQRPLPALKSGTSGSFIEWNDGLTIGVKRFDDQHRKLVDIINRLADAAKKGEGKRVLGPIFDELLNYTVTHFSEEQEAMERHGYPEAREHRKIHDNLVNQALNLKQKFEDGDLMVATETLDFLKNWLFKHIRQEDQKYSDYYREKGIHI